MTMLNIYKEVVTTTLPKQLVKNMDLRKYTRYISLVPHNYGYVKLTGVDGEQVKPHKFANTDARVKLILILPFTQAGTMGA